MSKTPQLDFTYRIFEAGYIVSEYKPKVYKVDGVVIADNNFDYKNVGIESYIENYKNNSFEVASISNKKVDFWRRGYTYYILNINDLSTLGIIEKNVLSLLKNIKGFMRLGIVIVGVRNTNNAEMIVETYNSVIAECRFLVKTAKKTIMKPKYPIFSTVFGGYLLSLYYTNNGFEVRPFYKLFFSRLRARTGDSRTDLVELGKDRLGVRYCSGHSMVYNHQTEIGCELSWAVRREGNFIVYGDYCCLDSGAEVGDTVIIPKQCKYWVYDFYLNEPILRHLKNFVVGKDIRGIVSNTPDGFGEEPFRHHKKLERICFSSKSNTETIVYLLRSLIYYHNDRKSFNFKRLLEVAYNESTYSKKDFNSLTEKQLRDFLVYYTKAKSNCVDLIVEYY